MEEFDIKAILRNLPPLQTPSVQPPSKGKKKGRVRYQGLFIPRNPKKYIGDEKKIVFRSLWEKQVMEYLDINPNVLNWGSEELVIPYLSPIDGKVHRYFPDFIVKMKDTNNKVKIQVLEVKPKKQTMLPEGKTMTKRLMEEMATYAVNTAKFEAATKFCESKGWEFLVITEEFLKP